MEIADDAAILSVLAEGFAIYFRGGTYFSFDETFSSATGEG
jgi:hypothetical protein